jgi:hypothetical protein
MHTTGVHGSKEGIKQRQAVYRPAIPLFPPCLSSAEGKFEYIGCDITEHRGQKAKGMTLIGILTSLYDSWRRGAEEHVLHFGRSLWAPWYPQLLQRFSAAISCQL